MPQWGFYGRKTELEEVHRLLSRGNFFFCSISGRRRIGKTSLIQEALKRRGETRKAVYAQIPDSDERGVIQVFEDAIEDTFSNQEFARRACANFSDIAILLQVLWNNGYISAIDEFQYFHRKSLSAFLSHLQSNIDLVRAKNTGGGLFALGSIHTEMTAVLEDKSSPLFNRVTDRINITHWDFETLFEMFREHEINRPDQRLFLWSLFEGIPKFYRDCFDHEILRSTETYRVDSLKRMFFEGSSPLKDEAENWFLRELRGRYDSVLKLVARMGPCSHGVLKNEYDRTGPRDDRQLGGYLQNLIEKYQMIERVSPIFAQENSRKARYRITDNFLTAWLSSLARNVQLARIRPLSEAIAKADESLKVHEGHTFEKMVKLSMEECSRKQKGDFSLSTIVKGYWNKPDGKDIEIDLVAINESDKIIRVGSCKRSAKKHDDSELSLFNGHVDRFSKTALGRKYKDWKIEKALYAPIFSEEQRKYLLDKAYICVDMNDFDKWLR
jgi:uncharacterized protein